MAELQFFSADDRPSRSGFRTLLLGPEHPEYANFCISPGHGFGYNEMITVEIKDMIEGIMGKSDLWPTFRDAVHTAAVVDSVLLSQAVGRWVSVPKY